LTARRHCVNITVKQIEVKNAMIKQYTTDSVQSRDGTTVGYKIYGGGNDGDGDGGLILLHGAMQASQNFSKLAQLLSDNFPVYVPDRRGRGLSGAYGENYCLKKEIEDAQAVIKKTGAENIYGLSSGAIIALCAAQTNDAIKRLALFEPPLLIADSSESPIDWSEKYEKNLENGRLAAALAYAMKGAGGAGLMEKLPRFILAPLLRLAMKAENAETKDGKEDVSITELVGTVRYDILLVSETKGLIENVKLQQSDILLLGGSKSKKYLHNDVLNKLSVRLPPSKRLIFKGLDHLATDDTGKPDIVAPILRQFFKSKA
jgi:pimeloyl-ACP methyl ester carboxylesterase